VICREAKGVEVLCYGHNGEKSVVVLVCWARESRFDELACYRYWVIGLVVQTSRYGGKDI